MQFGDSFSQREEEEETSKFGKGHHSGQSGENYPQCWHLTVTVVTTTRPSVDAWRVTRCAYPTYGHVAVHVCVRTNFPSLYRTGPIRRIARSRENCRRRRRQSRKLLIGRELYDSLPIGINLRVIDTPIIVTDRFPAPRGRQFPGICCAHNNRTLLHDPQPNDLQKRLHRGIISTWFRYILSAHSQNASHRLGTSITASRAIVIAIIKQLWINKEDLIIYY